MPVYIDQLNRRIDLPTKPVRIVSLVPSQTEFLYDIGLEQEVVGITNFCLHPPEWIKTKTRIGGTKKINFEKIRSLSPDLIIGNKEENQREQIEELMKHYPVWMSDIANLKDAYNMMVAIGEMTGKREKAMELKLRIEFSFNKFIAEQNSSSIPKPVAYLIWNKPLMVAGGGTFINHLLELCGFRNVFSTLSRYPEITAQQLQTSGAEYIFLSSEPFPFKEKHRLEFERLYPDIRTKIVDGEMFSWYGSRLLHAPDYFSGILKTI